IEHARHGTNFLAHTFSRAHEHGIHKRVGRQAGFTHHVAQFGSTAEPAKASNRKRHGITNGRLGMNPPSRPSFYIFGFPMPSPGLARLAASASLKRSQGRGFQSVSENWVSRIAPPVPFKLQPRPRACNVRKAVTFKV